MVSIVVNGHDFDDDFYEIIKKFFPKEEIHFINSVEEIPVDSLSFISNYNLGSINTIILLPHGKEVYTNDVELSIDQQEDENIVRYEIIKSLITGINSIEFL